MSAAEVSARRYVEQAKAEAYRALCRYGRVEAPLDWERIGRLPLEVGAGRLIELDRATADHFDQAADHYERRGQHPDGVTALRFLAGAARAAGVTFVRELDGQR
jgi:hypothetical protein